MPTLGSSRTDNVHGEYYLTDMAGVFAKAKAKVMALKTGESGGNFGAATRARR